MGRFNEFLQVYRDEKQRLREEKQKQQQERDRLRLEMLLAKWPRGTRLAPEAVAIDDISTQVEAQNRINAETIEALSVILKDGLDNLQITRSCQDLAEQIKADLLAMPLAINFESDALAAYSAASKLAIVEFTLPDVDIVPAVKNYRYVKSQDAVTGTARPISQIKTLYASAIAQISLLAIARVFKSDKQQEVETVAFNGVVDTIDPRRGKPIRPCLITVRVPREKFEAINLAHVDPLACLKHLSASVSSSPTELVPVRPILEFSMVDPRFVTATDAISLIDERPNLMDLTPTEFESLIQNLFEKMGLESRQTQASRDGGVDCIAYDTTPILGGKVVIQAKRYKNTVGVSAVRDLFGTLQNEGASKGILVTTSGYGAASFEFAQNKPIELIEGANLLYLLEEHCDIKARIEPPEDWRDPAPDAGEESAV